MTLFHRLASVLRWMFGRSRAEQQLDDELRSFVDMSAAERIRGGVSPEEARRQARIELGGVEQAKERVRTYRHGGYLDECGRDFRYALRMFARNPGFTVVVLLTLALGIGANTAIFSLIDALMLRSLPVRSPQELVQLNLLARGDQGLGGDSFSWVIVRALDDRREIFSGVTGFSGFSFNAGSPGSINRVPGALVTGSYYDTLGLEPRAGRLLTREDDEAGAPMVAVISYGYWERQFANSPNAVGQTVLLNGVPVTIVGVSPSGFVGTNVGALADITMPVAALSQLSPGDAGLLGSGNFWLRVLARPRQGTSNSEATARLNAAWLGISESVISHQWSAARRKDLADSVFSFSPGATGWTYLRGIYQKPLTVLMAGAGLVLLIACANAASLFLARASARQREIAVRLAIGAGRRRIVRQLLIESTALSLTGAAFGVGLAWATGRFLVDLISSGPSKIIFDLTPNWHVLAFASAVATATGIVFGLSPALRTTSVGPSSALREDARTTTARSKLLPCLVSGQVALSLVLLAGAALFVRTLQNLRSLDPGFKADAVFVVDLQLGRTPSPEALLDEVRMVPGVAMASLTTHTPLSGSAWSEPAVPAGQPVPEKDNARFVAVSPRFLETLQISLLAGRDFTDRDSAAGPAVALVNERYAERHFPRQNPVGQHLSAQVMGLKSDLEIVGLVKNTNAAGLRRPPPPTVFVAYAQFHGSLPPSLVIRAVGHPGRVAVAIRTALQSKQPAMPVEVRPLSAQVAGAIVQERMMATLAAGFGLLALALACVGLYGLLAYNVAQRAKEIGIRIALGAEASRVVTLVLGNGARLVLVGVALGLPVAWGVSRLVKSMLFALTPSDPVAIGGAIALLVASAVVAAYLPARRASRVDPLTALRHE